MNKMNDIRINLLFLLCFFVQFSIAQRVTLNTEEATILKEKVLKTARDIQTIKSDFIQKKHLDFLSNDIETFGKMVFKSPNLIKWEYNDPYKYSVVFKEEKLYINDDGDKSKVDLKGNEMFKSLNSLITKSMKGDLFDEEEFDIAYYSNEEHYLVDFRPKRKELNPYIKTFQLTFDKEEAQVLEVKMIEPSEDYTRIIFKNRKLNALVEAEVFSND